VSLRGVNISGPTRNGPGISGIVTSFQLPVSVWDELFPHEEAAMKRAAMRKARLKGAGIK